MNLENVLHCYFLIHNFFFLYPLNYHYELILPPFQLNVKSCSIVTTNSQIAVSILNQFIISNCSHLYLAHAQQQRSVLSRAHWRIAARNVNTLSWRVDNFPVTVFIFHFSIVTNFVFSLDLAKLQLEKIECISHTR